MINRCFFIEFLRRSSSQTIQLWKPHVQAWRLMHGKALLGGERSSNGLQVGEMGMESLWLFGEMVGCLLNTPQKFCQCEWIQ